MSGEGGNRDSLLAELTDRIGRVAEGDQQAVLEDAALQAAGRLAELTPATDLPVQRALGLFHMTRHLMLPAGQDRDDLRALMTHLLPIYLHNPAALPPELPGFLASNLELAPSAVDPDGTLQQIGQLLNGWSDPGPLATATDLLIAHVAARQQPPIGLRHLLALQLNALAIALSNRCRHQHALPPAKRATALLRWLAEMDPDTYLDDLANSLNNLGVYLADAGQCREAVAPMQEAVTIRRQLAEADPVAHQHGLAMALGNLGNRLADVGRRQDAVAPAQEATALYRKLAEDNLDICQGDYAKALDNLGAHLAGVGRHHEAASLTQESVTLLRELAKTDPDSYQNDLARSLNNLGNRLTKIGQHHQAVEPTQEAVAIRRRLTHADPRLYQADLASALNNLGIHLEKVGRHQEAASSARGIHRPPTRIGQN